MGIDHHFHHSGESNKSITIIFGITIIVRDPAVTQLLLNSSKLQSDTSTPPASLSLWRDATRDKVYYWANLPLVYSVSIATLCYLASETPQFTAVR